MPSTHPHPHPTPLLFLCWCCILTWHPNKQWQSSLYGGVGFAFSLRLIGFLIKAGEGPARSARVCFSDIWSEPARDRYLPRATLTADLTPWKAGFSAKFLRQWQLQPRWMCGASCLPPSADGRQRRPETAERFTHWGENDSTRALPDCSCAIGSRAF